VKKEPPKKIPPPLAPSTLAKLKERLLEERERHARQADELQAEADSLSQDREQGDTQFDEESGEGDTLAVERDFDLARAAQARQTVEEIDAALDRIAKDVYGICEYSGEAIPKERLKAIPWARERVEHKTRSFR
jgi:RNA polymerase-binding transcription factor DksA